jgi:hypothetical protein
MARSICSLVRIELLAVSSAATDVAKASATANVPVARYGCRMVFPSLSRLPGPGLWVAGGSATDERSVVQGP